MLLLLEGIEHHKSSPYKWLAGHAYLAIGLVLVLNPKAQQFKLAHSHFSNWLIRVSADSATNIVDIASVEFGQGLFVLD